MTLEQHLNHIRVLREEGDKRSQADWDESISQYIAYLNQSASASELKAILKSLNFDLEFSLPTIDVLFPMYRRLVELERNPEHLRMLATCLYIYGNDWDDEAADLHREADEMEQQT
jgi:hypothetical protein